MSLVAWYPLNGDLKNNGNSDFDLKNSGATIEDNGKIGKCYYFNGSNSRLYGKLDISSMNYGIAIWVKFSQIISETQWIFCLNNNASNTDVQLGIFVNTSGFNLCGVGDSDSIAYNYDVQTDIWYHIVLTANGEKMKFYLNGELMSEYDIKSEVIKHNFTLGARSNNSEGAGVNSVYHLKGYMNDVRIYNHCLSDAEVKEISKGLMLHYTMNNPYGGSNLLLGSDRFSGAGGNASGITSSITENGELKVIAEKNNANWKSFAMSNHSGTIESIQNNMNVGDEFVVSFDIKIESGSGIPTLFLNSGNNYESMIGNPNLTGEWQRVYKVRTWKEPRNDIWIFRFAFGI